MDCIVYGVTESRTLLGDFYFHFHAVIYDGIKEKGKFYQYWQYWCEDNNKCKVIEDNIIKLSKQSKSQTNQKTRYQHGAELSSTV